MTVLARYEAARTALAEAHKIDEVKDIRDKAEAMAAYARQAKDMELIQWATEIKVRAERRAGQMLAAELPADKGRSNVAKSLISPGSNDTTPGAKLSDFGVSKDQSAAWQKLAAMPEEHFETAVSAAKDAAGQVTTAFMLREARRSDPKPRPKPAIFAEVPKPTVEERLRAQIEVLKDEVEALKVAMASAEDTAQDLADHAQNLQALENGEEIKRLDLMTMKFRASEARVSELMSENAALKRMIKALQREAARAV